MWEQGDRGSPWVLDFSSELIWQRVLEKFGNHKIVGLSSAKPMGKLTVELIPGLFGTSDSSEWLPLELILLLLCAP